MIKFIKSIDLFAPMYSVNDFCSSQMNTDKVFLGFCNEFTFYDHKKIERAIELNIIRDCELSML